jgi:GntR family transcriptional repressor for pyruvate dehydrogenase complex
MTAQPTIQAIKVQRLYLQVARQLQDLIGAGTFAAGSRLPSERDLAAQFGVSRPTIREAMIALEIAGLVDVRSGSGVYVTDAPPRSPVLDDSEDPGPFEILEARKVIEAETCALAAARINDEQLAQLAALLEAMAEENRQASSTERADETFHCLIAQAAGNSALSASVHWLWQLRNESPISTYFHERVREEGDRPILADHQAILDALRSRDAAASREAMKAHLQRVIDHLLETQ